MSKQKRGRPDPERSGQVAAGESGRVNNQNNFTTEGGKRPESSPVIVWIPKRETAALDYLCRRLTGQSVRERIQTLADGLLARLRENHEEEAKGRRRKRCSHTYFLTHRNLDRKSKKTLARYFSDLIGERRG